MTSFRFLIVILLGLIFPCSSYSEDKLPFKVPNNLNVLPETALIETTKGPIEIAFYRKEAPISVRNFEYLVKKGFYKNLSFFHHKENFMIQGGCPLNTGKGGPGYFIPPELSEIKHRAGTLGMARLPSPVNPERLSHGSQFYITLRTVPQLDGLYTVFARVINGMENVYRLRRGDKILNVLFPIR